MKAGFQAEGGGGGLPGAAVTAGLPRARGRVRWTRHGSAGGVAAVGGPGRQPAPPPTALELKVLFRGSRDALIAPWPHGTGV